MENSLELRMYSLVMYNLSPIQQGIQAYHATIEATQRFNNSNSISKENFDNWAKNWKTVIILNGGTSKTMEEHFEKLWENKIGVSYFREPDLNNSMSAISFIVDERVFNKEKYPDFYHPNGLLSKEQQKQTILYKEYLENIGGEKNAFLREFLSQFRLA
jgi:hypothetical protein